MIERDMNTVKVLDYNFLPIDADVIIHYTSFKSGFQELYEAFSCLIILVI